MQLSLIETLLTVEEIVYAGIILWHTPERENSKIAIEHIAEVDGLYMSETKIKFVLELQKVDELLPNLKFMVSTSLILTQCKQIEKPAGQCCAPDKNIFPYHLSV